MKIKTIEIRDVATFIPAIAIEMTPDNENQVYLLRRTGFAVDLSAPPQIVLMRLTDQKAHADPYDWGDRTMTAAHDYIEKNFDALSNGAVVDVEYILGESNAPKVSEKGLPY